MCFAPLENLVWLRARLGQSFFTTYQGVLIQFYFIVSIHLATYKIGLLNINIILPI